MISKIGSDIENKYTPNWAAKPSFTGVGNIILQGVQLCEKNPMLNVSVIDLSTAIIPRTVIETKESNVFAGMEAFRRESSGLIVNCLIPSFIVMGVSALLQKPIMKGFGKASLHNVWANEESLNIIKNYLLKAEGNGNAKLENALTSFLNDISSVDGESKKLFKDIDLKSSINKLSEATDKKSIKAAYSEIASKTHMTEYLDLKGHGVLSKNLEGMLGDFVNVFRATEKEGITNKSLEGYIKKAVKLVNAKSLAGLGIIIPLAISMQPINRWITAKTSGVKGAPIYKDFTTSTDNKELTKQEKQSLWKQKMVSVASMIGVMLLSMGRIPGKEAFQFKGIFPTMDQARIISTATFSSRMLSSEDKHELREATIRDIITFSSLYFLGDYAAKGIATLIQKINPKIKLLNKIKDLPKNAGSWSKFKHWVKDIKLKSSDEVVGKLARNMRSVCQLGSFAFSLLVLGLFVPLYTRTQTNKKREQELKALAMSTTSVNGFLKDQIQNSSPTFKSFLNKE